MSAIGPGDWVECIDASPSEEGRHFCEADQLVLGTVYCVSAAWVWRDSTPVILVGRERSEASEYWGVRCGYGVRRFRLIYRPKNDLIERLKSSKPALVPA